MKQGDNSQKPEIIFNQVYERHYSSLYAYFFGRTNDAEMSLDFLQETFTRAWQNISSLMAMEKSQHQYWLFSIAKNLLTDSLRRSARWQKIEGDMISSAKGNVPNATETMATHNQLIVLEEAIGQLPEHLRIVLSMSVLGGMNSKRIGEALETPSGTVRYQLSQARKQLMDYLEQE